jgi:hypothetical protein
MPSAFGMERPAALFALFKHEAPSTWIGNMGTGHTRACHRRRVLTAACRHFAVRACMIFALRVSNIWNFLVVGASGAQREGGSFLYISLGSLVSFLIIQGDVKFGKHQLLIAF